MHKSKLIAALLTAGFASAVFAAQPAFEEVDKNGDGSISREEAAKVEGMNFDGADTNKDGALSKAEYGAAGK